MTNQFDWLRYLNVADHLLTQQGEEFFRSATSRAYYGLFCHIRDALEQRQGQPFPPERSVHIQVIDALKNDSRSSVIQLGTDLDRLRRERNRADYRTNTFTLSRGRKSLLLARDIQTRLVATIP